MIAYFVLVLISVGIAMASAKWVIALIRRRLGRKIVLYQFQDVSYSRRIQAWHCVGEERALQNFMSRAELQRSVRVSWKTPENKTFVGTYKKRFVGNFGKLYATKGLNLKSITKCPHSFDLALSNIT